MVGQIWNIQAILAFVTAVYSTELLPERYLKPKDFNHHPFTDVGLPASLKKALKLSNPYSTLAEKRLREGQDFPPLKILFYPTPHPSTLSRKQIESNEINDYDDHYRNVPKNYAFSYMVKDRHSGDDFSHSQAHNGKATRGQYRVKLPDGRTQIVSYTADHSGYRADVQYEEDLISKEYVPTVQNTHQTSLPNTVQNYLTDIVPKDVPTLTHSPSILYRPAHKEESLHYLPNPTKITPIHYTGTNTALKVLSNHRSEAIATLPYNPNHSQKLVNFVSSTPAPQIHQYTSPAASAQHFPLHYVSSTPLYPLVQASTITPLPQKDRYQNYNHLTPIISSQQNVVTTPRPVYHSNDGKNAYQSPTLLYRVL